MAIFPRKDQEDRRRLRAPVRLSAVTVIQFWHLASLDAPTVAVVWSRAFAWSAHRSIPLWILPLEALVVWAVYVGDRLLDARRGVRGDGDQMRARHWFHWRHRRILAPLAAVALLAAACIALLWMPLATCKRDSLLGLASCAYFARVHHEKLYHHFFSKEIFVGLLFTSGCALPSLSSSSAVPVLFFATLAWLNCAAIEDWESSIPRGNVFTIALCLAAIGFIAAVFSSNLQTRSALLLICGATSAALISVLHYLRRRMPPLTLRTLVDFVLLTPAILLTAAAANAK